MIERLHDAAYAAKVQRAVVLHVEAFDWNWHQQVTPRYTVEQFKAVVRHHQREQPMED